jgi:hypothetical protein
MAKFTPRTPPSPISISNWLGVNESVGTTNLALGEALSQYDFRITKDYKLEKREGHSTIIDFSNSTDVQAMWYGTIGTKTVLIAVNGGNVYEFEEGELT